MRLEWLIPHSDILFQSGNGKGVWCNVCDTEFICTTKTHIERHVTGSNHIKRLDLLSGPFKPKEHEVTTTDFNMDLCEAFLRADIPLLKLKDPHLKSFLEKYCKRPILTESTLRKNYIEKVYLKTMVNIRQKLEGKKLWVAVEETTDFKNRYVANIIVGPLDTQECETSYLISSKFLPKTNSDTIFKVTTESFNALFPENDSIRENVLLFLSDSAPHMLNAGKNFREYFKNMLHITCFVHALHNICEFIREHYPLVDSLISETKKFFLKSPSRIVIFKETCPDLKLPPQPVITRWGTWLSAALYYFKNLNSIQIVFENLKDDVQSVKKCKSILNNPDLPNHLKFISDYFGDVPDIIKKLETQNLPALEAFDLYETIIEKLKSTPSQIGQDLKVYIKHVLKKNPDYTEMRNIVFDLKDHPNSANEHFRYVPLINCEVERSFSRLREILNTKRTRTEQNYEKVVIISCNSTKI